MSYSIGIVRIARRFNIRVGILMPAHVLAQISIADIQRLSTHNPDNPEIPAGERYGYQEVRLSREAAEQVDAGTVYYLFHIQPGVPDHELLFGHRFSDGYLTPLDGRQIANLRGVGSEDGTVWNTVIAEGSN